jgi:hypothetical protein
MADRVAGSVMPGGANGLGSMAPPSVAVHLLDHLSPSPAAKRCTAGRVHEFFTKFQ